MRRLLGAAALFTFAAVAAAQSYPSRPIRMILPNPPGGANDIVGRIVAQQLASLLGQQIVVDNRGGAGGAIAAEIAANAVPDGHTLLAATFATHTTIPHLQKKIGYDPLNGFAPIARFAVQYSMLSAHPAFPPRSVKELIAYAKANPGKVNWATQGLAGSSHLVGELFKSLAGVDLFAVHYKGSTPANVDIMAGRADLHFDGSGTALPNIAAKRVKAIAHTAEKRIAAAPDLPTFVETLPGMVAYSWYGVVTPAGTPQPVIARLNAEVNAFVKTPEIVERMNRDGSEPGSMTPAQFGAMIAEETALWRKVLTPLNLKLD